MFRGQFNKQILSLSILELAFKTSFLGLKWFLFLLLNFLQNQWTWSRTINNVVCTSIIDHIYVRDPTKITALTQSIPLFGDHTLIIFSLRSTKTSQKSFYKRNWKSYNRELPNKKLKDVRWEMNLDDVQSYWNTFESLLIEIVDHLVPFENTKDSNTSLKPPQAIRAKINRRNRLIKKLKCNHNNPQTRHDLKSLSKEIKKISLIKKQKQ